MVETVFDTLNAKAALFAIEEAFDARGARLPVMISGHDHRRLRPHAVRARPPRRSGIRCATAQPLAIGLNCALGAKDLRPHVDVLAQVADAYVSTHPNAGLPNAFGGYDETPGGHGRRCWASSPQAGLLNLVGGCCGTTPAHIAAIADGGCAAMHRARAGAAHWRTRHDAPCPARPG